ncbi:hypothetical protein [Maritalea myrionectae]|uniref:hypothetical protein n=1 Tax=Maritalea myrionectae TaxID=454601 RepID=UPI00047F5C13|nr:hypothetical protein [Maritalea myrionectae]
MNRLADRIATVLFYLLATAILALALLIATKALIIIFPGYGELISSDKIKWSMRTGTLEGFGWAVTLLIAVIGIQQSIKRTIAMEDTLRHSVENSKSQQLQHALEMLASEKAPQQFAAITSMIAINDDCGDDLRKIMLNALCRYASFRNTAEMNEAEKRDENTHFNVTLDVGTAELLYSAIASISSAIGIKTDDQVCKIEKAEVICDVKGLDFYAIAFNECTFTKDVLDCSFCQCQFQRTKLVGTKGKCAFIICEFKSCSFYYADFERFADGDYENLPFFNPNEPTPTVNSAYCTFQDCRIVRMRLVAYLCEVSGGSYEANSVMDLSACWYKQQPICAYGDRTRPFKSNDYQSVEGLKFRERRGRFLDVYGAEHHSPSPTAS